MATFVYSRQPSVGRQKKYAVEERRFPNDAPKKPLLDSDQLLEIRPGVRGFFPVGTVTREDGFTRKR